MSSDEQRPFLGLHRTDWLFVAGLSIAWLFFRGDYFMRALCLNSFTNATGSGQIAYYVYIVALIISCGLGITILKAKPNAFKLVHMAICAIAGPLLIVVGGLLDGQASIAAESCGVVFMAFYVIIATTAWGRIACSFEPQNMFATLTCAFVVSSFASIFFRFLPDVAFIATMAIMPACSAVLYGIYNARGARADARPHAKPTPTQKRDWLFLVLLAIFAIVAFCVRGLVRPLEYPQSPLETASINIVNVLVGIIALAYARKRNVDRALHAMARVFMVVTFAVLCLYAATRPNASSSVINQSFLAIRGCFTYVLFVATCSYTQQHSANAPASISLAFSLPMAVGAGLRSLLFFLDSSVGPYLTYVTPILVFVLAVAVIASPLPEKHEDDANASSDTPASLVDERFVAAYRLTPRETDVAQCLVRGYTLEKTADKLCISLNTVRTHSKSIYRKVGVSSKQELIEAAEERFAKKM